MKRAIGYWIHTGERAMAATAAALAGFLAPIAIAQPSILGQARVDVTAPANRAANNTVAAASAFSPERIVAAWIDWRQSPVLSSEILSTGVGLSLDGGITWSDMLVRPPVANQTLIEASPMAAADPRTGTMWVGGISYGTGGGVYVARLDPTATAFSATKMARLSASADRAAMATGPKPGDANSTRLYITFNEGCIRSDDLGDTWNVPVSLGSGVGFLPRVASDGTLYVAYWDQAGGLLIKRSTNGGSSFVTKTIATRLDTWTIQDSSRFPGNFRVIPTVCIAVSPVDGALYAVYCDRTRLLSGRHDIDLYFTKSTNKGDTWSAPTHTIHGDALNQDQFFPWIEVDREGRLHVSWWDGRHTDQNDATTNTDAWFDNYYAYSEDAGATWHEYRLSENTWNAANDGLIRNQQFVGDMSGMACAGRRITPVYVDTRGGDPDIYASRLWFCKPDVNRDGYINGDDYDFFALAFEVGSSDADYNHDGYVNGDDYDFFGLDFEEGCP